MGHAMWWLAGAVVLGIIEVGTVDFVFLMLALGALGAGAASALGAGFAIEVAVFSLVAVLGLLLGRPWIKARLAASTPDVRTNVHALVGARAVVLAETDAHDGRIRLEGEVWSARTEGPPLAEGAQVRVLAIDGATALVEASDDGSEPSKGRHP